jgi:hypothetical protein
MADVEQTVDQRIDHYVSRVRYVRTIPIFRVRKLIRLLEQAQMLVPGEHQRWEQLRRLAASDSMPLQ